MRQLPCIEASELRSCSVHESDDGRVLPLHGRANTTRHRVVNVLVPVVTRVRPCKIPFTKAMELSIK